jgi:hypothetical protein
MRFPFKRVLLGFAIVIAALMIWGMFWLQSGWDERLSNKAVVIDRESESPDRTMVLVIYRFDTGALGYTAERDVVVPTNRLHGDLKRYILPKQYDPIGWEKDGSLTVAINIVECLRENEDCSRTYDTFAGTRINVRRDDETQGNQQEIEADLPSPNHSLRLVAYRYPNDDRSNLGRIHISIVGMGEQVPRYGNYYIASMGGDGVLGARWDSDRSIIFLTSPSQKYLLQDADSFRVQRSAIPYKVEIDDKLSGYLWVNESATKDHH